MTDMVDPADSSLGRMLQDEITPVVMVLRTELVEESCQKNGLSLIEMLSPFCDFNNIDVPVRTASDQPYRLQKFKLRLYYASDIHQPNVEVAKDRLKQVISHAGEKDFARLCSTDPPQIENVLTTSQPELVPSWFSFFNKELVHTVSFSEHEAFDHPVACLLVISSKDEDSVNKFIDLFNTDQLPPLLNDGAMDPKILKYYLLLHDNQDGTSEKAIRGLTDMRNTFGSNNCGLLCINSSEDGVVDHQENLWNTYKSSASPNERLGGFLTMDDLDELKNVMQDLSSKYIIPHMEQKIRVLNQQVSATRRGFRNQIKNLWWRKGSDVPESTNGSTYTFSSIESQIRVLGDYAFMLRDYELALSNYRLLSTDYKLDKAWKRYAGVQEMMGLTYFMLDQSRKDAEYSMENAFTTYLKLGLSGQRNATRCGLWWVEMLKARDQFKDAATVYIRISSEEPLHSAVMLEQASYCYLYAKPPMLRKYGFHLVLAGDLYKKSDQVKHAIRTYRSALTVFKGTKWSHIRDHVHFHVGKWYALLGMFDVSINNILEVLACDHQSKATQELFLRDFFQIVQNTGKTFEVLRLQLPVIHIPSLKVVFEDHRTYASLEAVDIKESSWKSLEEDIVPSVSIIKSNWLDSQPKHVSKKLKETNLCVAGEAIKVEIGFKNPLQIPISISGVSLICEHSALSGETGADANSLVPVDLDDDRLRVLAACRETSSFTLSEVDISLGADETLLAQLTVIPRQEGTLRIVGVRWKLSGSVAGFYNFDSHIAKKKVTKRSRKSKRTPADNLEFVVIKTLPKLKGFIRDIPKTVYAGDIRRLNLELSNPSEIPVKNIKMKINHPRFLSIGNPEVMDAEFPSCLERTTGSAASSMQLETNYLSDKVFVFPEDALVHGESPLLWPLWLRGATQGKISLYITVYYEMEDPSCVIRYRTLRMYYELEVLPSLDVLFQISPCPSRLQELLVRMDVVNRTSTKSFQVHQLSSVGHELEISLLQPVDTILPSEVLSAGQALSCFFKLKCGRKLGIPNDEASISPLLEGPDVSLKFGSNESLFDIHKPPLVDFHHHERLHQQSADQVKYFLENLCWGCIEDNSNTVDFILIYRQQSPKDDASLFSHHACHCSTSSTSPIGWLLEGPRTLYHKFSDSFCEIKLKMTLRNSSNATASIRIDTSPSTSKNNAPAVPSGSEEGWHDISLLADVKVTSDVPQVRVGKSVSSECVEPFIWSGTSSTRIKLEPMSTMEIPLQVCVFSPGTYDLSNYTLHWNLLPSSNGQVNQGLGVGQSSGKCQGHPYYLTVLPSP